MIHASIGLIVGIIMGLTGAGGALVSIPLFMQLLDTSLKDATILSLVAVLFGTGINLLGLIKKIEAKIVFSFFIFGSLANYLTLPLKTMLPEIAIASILALIGVYSIWSVWRGNVTTTTTPKTSGLLKMALTGLVLGIVTTLTGLGGGVILVPILITFFAKTYEEALPSSLATIFLISSVSLILQMKTGLELIALHELGYIGLGAIIAFVTLKALMRFMNTNLVIQLRKIVFTMVTVYSIITVFMKTL